jgi:acyl carrier protein
MATADKVRDLISKQLNRPVEEITEDKEVVKDLGADSLDVVEMLMSLEEEFNITVPEEDAVNIKTVGDIVKVIDEKKREIDSDTLAKR